MSLSFLFYVSARQIVRLRRHFGTYPLFTDPESFLHLKLKWYMYINKGLSHVFIKQNKRLSFLLLRRCSTLSILYCGIEYFEIYNKTSEFFDLSDNMVIRRWHFKRFVGEDYTFFVEYMYFKSNHADSKNIFIKTNLILNDFIFD